MISNTKGTLKALDQAIKNAELDENQDADYIGHRQRLKARYITDEGYSMPDYELLELLLMYAIPRKDVKPLAKSLMKKYLSLGNVLAAPIENLLNFSGIGSNAAVLISLVHSCAKKITWENLESEHGPIMTNRSKIVEYCRSCIAYANQEQLLIIYLDIYGRYITDKIEQVGTINAVSLNAREIIAQAITNKACGIILSHNHPSGDSTPSESDIRLTKELKTALKAVQIKLEDHIIITPQNYFSMKEHLPFMLT